MWLESCDSKVALSIARMRFRWRFRIDFQRFYFTATRPLFLLLAAEFLAIPGWRQKSIHQRCFRLWELKCLNSQKRGLVYTKKLVFDGKRRKIHIHQRAFKVFVGDPFAQYWCIDFGLLPGPRFWELCDSRFCATKVIVLSFLMVPVLEFLFGLAPYWEFFA